eukprot:TRINITY_DN4239_c2_g1_i1.p1 TRINITY_DN4239_c2_g1~~TRINITY_DN4239_c2_g1_i1.p1  ORF type:complete len:1138 (+),score=365.34 TRINITY_DN4239_c2_g1_i1:259-3672(+)
MQPPPGFGPAPPRPIPPRVDTPPRGTATGETEKGHPENEVEKLSDDHVGVQGDEHLLQQLLAKDSNSGPTLSTSLPDSSTVVPVEAKERPRSRPPTPPLVSGLPPPSGSGSGTGEHLNRGMRRVLQLHSSSGSNRAEDRPLAAPQSRIARGPDSTGGFKYGRGKPLPSAATSEKLPIGNGAFVAASVVGAGGGAFTRPSGSMPLLERVKEELANEKAELKRAKDELAGSREEMERLKLELRLKTEGQAGGKEREALSGVSQGTAVGSSSVDGVLQSEDGASQILEGKKEAVVQELMIEGAQLGQVAEGNMSKEKLLEAYKVLQQLHEELSGAKTEVEQLAAQSQRALTAASSELEEWRKASRESGAEISKLREEVVETKSEIGRLQHELFEAKFEMGRMKQEAQQRDDAGSRTGAVPAGEVSRLVGELDRAKEDLQRMQKELSERSTEVTKLRNEMSDAVVGKQKLEAEVSELGAVVERLRLQNVASVAEKGKAEEEIAKKEQETKDVHAQRQVAQAEVDKLKEQLERARGEIGAPRGRKGGIRRGLQGRPEEEVKAAVIGTTSEAGSNTVGKEDGERIVEEVQSVADSAGSQVADVPREVRQEPQAGGRPGDGFVSGVAAALGLDAAGPAMGADMGRMLQQERQRTMDLERRVGETENLANVLMRDLEHARRVAASFAERFQQEKQQQQQAMMIRGGPGGPDPGPGPSTAPPPPPMSGRALLDRLQNGPSFDLQQQQHQQQQQQQQRDLHLQQQHQHQRWMMIQQEHQKAVGPPPPPFHAMPPGGGRPAPPFANAPLPLPPQGFGAFPFRGPDGQQLMRPSPPQAQPLDRGNGNGGMGAPGPYHPSAPPPPPLPSHMDPGMGFGPPGFQGPSFAPPEPQRAPPVPSSGGDSDILRLLASARPSLSAQQQQQQQQQQQHQLFASLSQPQQQPPAPPPPQPQSQVHFSYLEPGSQQPSPPTESLLQRFFDPEPRALVGQRPPPPGFPAPSRQDHLAGDAGPIGGYQQQQQQPQQERQAPIGFPPSRALIPASVLLHAPAAATAAAGTAVPGGATSALVPGGVTGGAPRPSLPINLGMSFGRTEDLTSRAGMGPGQGEWWGQAAEATKERTEGGNADGDGLFDDEGWVDEVILFRGRAS